MVASNVATAQQNLKNVINIAASAVISTNQNCNLDQFANQTINFNGNIVGSTIDAQQIAQQYATLQCVQSVTDDIDFLNKINTDVTQKLQAQASAGISASIIAQSTTSTKTTTELIQNFANSVNITTLQQCLADMTANQSINFGNITDSTVSVGQTIAQVGAVGCLQKQSSAVAAGTDLANAITLDASATSATGINLDFAQLGVIGLVVFLAFVALIIFLVFFRNRGGSGAAAAPATVPVTAQ